MNFKKETIIIIYTISIGLIVSGLCLRFGGEKFIVDLYLKKYNDSPSKRECNLIKYGGIALYIGGWIIAAICLSMKHTGNKILKHSIFSAIIISLVWVIFEVKEENFIFQPKVPLLSCSVLLSSLIALTSLRYNIKDIILIVIGSILIIFSEYFILPFQRNNNIQDGIGLPILILGWFILFYAFDGDSTLQKTILKNKVEIPLMSINTVV
ncbi:hypothetical protein IIV30_099R [Invertebrate iridescent virus 30]|uniref:Uncharacterized protein n=1 Tax=Invertebrate iridescent virus 30 TaxID=345585 RepID=W8W2X4_9VIRU|nr:hypothetical protein IIV30_099R [Invertebrate iridescent virus 30]CCV02294.1 hypothetical protein IIV30_099R [Invertebrate iridescent virus 30]